MSRVFDIAILGAGFAGSLLAMIARRLGLRVLLLERGSHPRFAIGESSSPLCNLLLEELAHRYDLPRLLPLTAYGPWKRTYPEIGVGLKRGFTFYLHRAGRAFEPDPERAEQLLVAASSSDEVADTHWYRADFDHFLVREAVALGTEYVDRVNVTAMRREGAIATLEGERQGRPVSGRARFVVDASGPRGALSRMLGLPEEPFPQMPRTRALFSHFVGVRRFVPTVVPEDGAEPYRPDDAALHHLFEGGWMWVLRFDNGLTSAGFAVDEETARELRLEDGESAWERFLRRFPSIARQFEEAEATLPFVHAPRLPYCCARIVGAGWALLPSAAAFIDPLFSTGFPLTLLGIQRLARALEEAWGRPELEARLAEYGAVTRSEAHATARLVGACYRSFGDFPTFVSLSMLYFTAASYSEMARRLGRRHLAGRFLLQDRPAFRAAFLAATDAALGGRPLPPDRIAAALEPFNVAGLCDPAKRNRYPADPADVVRGAAKLECSPGEVTAFFQRMGW